MRATVALLLCACASQPAGAPDAGFAPRVLQFTSGDYTVDPGTELEICKYVDLPDAYLSNHYFRGDIGQKSRFLVYQCFFHCHSVDAQYRFATSTGLNLGHPKPFQMRGGGIDVTGIHQVGHKIP